MSKLPSNAQSDVPASAGPSPETSQSKSKITLGRDVFNYLKKRADELGTDVSSILNDVIRTERRRTHGDVI